MDAKLQIDKAIGAHGMWKTRLKLAIDAGTSEFDPKKVETDNECDFGKWLYYDISPELKRSAFYKTIVQYHAEFHKEAARILRLALAGKKEEAKNGMKGLSKFASISGSLTTNMMEWKKSLV